MTDSEINWPRQAAIDLISLPSREVADARPPIKYGEWAFSAPRLMFKRPVPAKAGMFVIQIRKRHWFSWRYEPIHFGESSNLYKKLVAEAGDDYVRWLMHPDAVDGLFVSIFPTTGMSKPEREFAANRLLSRYCPELTRSAEELMAELDDPLDGNWREDFKE